MRRPEATGIWALLTTLSCAAVMAVVFAQFPSAQIWAHLTPGDCTEYCERHTSCVLALAQRPAIQQPLNSWSNLGFVFVGLLAILRLPVTGAWLFGLSCVVLGVGSFLFHASVTYAFQWLDVVGMYVVEAALVAWALHRTWGAAYGWLLPLVLAADVGLALFKWQLNTVLMMVGMGAAIAVLMAMQVRAGRQSLRNALLPGLLIALAYGIRELDVQKILCAPNSLLFQGHALWHLLCAATVHLVFTFFAPRSEP